MFSGVIGSVVKGPQTVTKKLNPTALSLQKDFEQQQKRYYRQQLYEKELYKQELQKEAEAQQHQKNVEDAYAKNAKEFEEYEKTGDLERTPEQLCQCTGKCRCENGETCSSMVCDVDSRCLDTDARWETNTWGVWKFPWRKVRPCGFSSPENDNDLRGPTALMTGGYHKKKLILNPKTKRWVKRDGKIGQQILEQRRRRNRKIRGKKQKR